ncbi:MAG: glycyl-radical enzyme activating protein [Dehalococcoidales bacterium]|nr:glycyl-radical enzyme activating protein [Dehalococcoidales bacterium]
MVIKGIVFNIQRYSLDDGPGIRTTVFLKGCPLKCRWCSNPESQNIYTEISFRNSVCNKCGECSLVCKEGAIKIDDEGVNINRKLCSKCFNCVDVCAPQALKVIGKETSVDEVMAEIRKDLHFYQESGGGVTVSGGEPLAQASFTGEILKTCQEEGIHTCVETCGYGTKESLNKILPFTSLIYFDVKHIDPTIHKKFTGRSNKLIIDNLKYVASKGIPLVIRVPVITSFNDSDEVINNIACLVAGINKPLEIHLLPYHNYGIGKYKMLGRKYSLEELSRPIDSKLKILQEIVSSFGLNCEIVK